MSATMRVRRAVASRTRVVPEAGNPVNGYKYFHGRGVAGAGRGPYIIAMKKVELSDEAYAALQRLAVAKNLSPAEIVAALVDPQRPPLAGDHLLFYLASEEFTRLADPIDRYLDLLAWCAKNYATDFADFISHQESGRRYLAWNRDEINEARARNQARQIDGTQFWAVMSIDDATRRRFVCRLLEFIGCHDETVTQACRVLGFTIPAPSVFRRLSA
jgi:negative regulator of replication initiation